ncbi:MAG: Dyp-type peroxidase [Actinomycetota bacterium]|nr:Dyp-type peroxidase [Actinomycetota bacterium]
MASRSLQEGIYFDQGQTPGRFFGLLFLRAGENLGAGPVGEALAGLWRLYQGLKRGRVPDLDPVVVPHEEDELSVLLGFGSEAFALSGAKHARPDALDDDNLFDPPRPEGGGLVLDGSGLAYAPEVTVNPAAGEFCVQVIAETKLAVDRTVVETWKWLTDHADSQTGAPALRVTSFFVGAARADRRSWIDFHDGISNMHSQEREGAIVIKQDVPPDDDWTVGGTYLAFVRLAVDLTAWRTLSRRQQELLVGRDKLNGCPITAIAEDGSPVTDPGCPVAGTEIWETPNDPLYAEPLATGDAVIQASHVQRANHHQRPASRSSSRRIFRQGYEFLEWTEQAPGFRAGLNFVSFQDTPERLVQMLINKGWLGQVNFGGDAQTQLPGMASLLSAYASGVFLVPPRAAEEGALPGGSLLGL